MATVREITTLFNFKPKLGGLKKSIISVDKLKAGLKRLGVGVVAAAAGIFALAKTTANYGDNIAKTSQKIGLSTDALQELIFASKLSGVEQSTLEGAIKRLSRGMLEASMGVAEYADTYKDLGIDVNDGNGKLKASDVIMEELADKLAAMEDGTKKTALAQEFFGRAGAELIPLLNAGSKGIKKMRKEARDLGLIMSQKATKASEAFNDELLRTTEVVLALKRRISLALLPLIKKLSKAFREWVSVNRDLIAQRLNKVLKVIAFAMGVIVGFVKRTISIFSGFNQALEDGAFSALLLKNALILLAGAAVIRALAGLGRALKAALLPLSLILKNPLVAAGTALFAVLATEVEVLAGAIEKGITNTTEKVDELIKSVKESIEELEIKQAAGLIFVPEQIKTEKEILRNLLKQKSILEKQNKEGRRIPGSITQGSIKTTGQPTSNNNTNNNTVINVNTPPGTNGKDLAKIVVKEFEDLIKGTRVTLRNKLDPQKKELGFGSI